MCQSKADYEKFKVKDSQIQMTFWKPVKTLCQSELINNRLYNFIKEFTIFTL